MSGNAVSVVDAQAAGPVDLQKPATSLSDDLVKAQFNQLIEAIKANRERINQITLSAVVGLPTAILLAKSFEWTAFGLAANLLIIVSPFLIFFFVLFYISERSAIRRYGTYIEKYIDPLMQSDLRPDFSAWSSSLRGDQSFAKSTQDYDDAKFTGMVVLITIYAVSALFTSGHTITYYILGASSSGTSKFMFALFIIISL